MGMITRQTARPADPSAYAYPTAPPAGYMPHADADTPSCDGCHMGYPFTLCDMLKECIGYYIITQHLVGSGNMETKQGLLVRVESNAFILYDESSGNYIFCDYYSLKFFYRLPFRARREPSIFERVKGEVPSFVQSPVPHGQPR